MRHLRELLIDAWSWLNYKQAMAHPARPGQHAFPELNTSWVPDADMRRLAGYMFLAAYDSNQAGQLASITGDDHHGVERRELGDPSKLIDTTLSYLLGPKQTIVVPGAEHADEADEPTPEVKAAADLQERLRSWADKELLPLRMQQVERCAVRCGDSVYTVAWKPAKRRVLLRTYDPGWYFPEWDEGEQDAQEYPQRVHFAWELPADPVRGLKDRVRRITYGLGPIGAATAPGRTADGRAIHEQVAGADGDPMLIVGDTLDPLTGTVTRTYPWAPGKPTATDTDSASASSTTGTPIVALAGARLPIDRSTGQPLPVRVEAGSVCQLNDNGRMDTLDTSAQLAELRQRVDHLIDRLAANTRLTAAGFGSLDPANCRTGTRCRSLSARSIPSSAGCGWPATTSTSCCCAWCSACTRPGRSGSPASRCLPASCGVRTPPPTAPPSSTTSCRATRRVCSPWRPQSACCRKPDTPSRTSPRRSSGSRSGPSTRLPVSPTRPATMRRSANTWAFPKLTRPRLCRLSTRGRPRRTARRPARPRLCRCRRHRCSRPARLGSLAKPVQAPVNARPEGSSSRDD
ncbi:hypothetical protein [Streptomyces sp. NPDC093984]|uniref:hypothetical protein n=1 Tax=Streptomyces sp. NPDC093984 TaxID=3366052 RepID=UPI003824DE4F